MSGNKQRNSDIFLSYFLQSLPLDQIPLDASPSTLHPFAHGPSGDPRPALKDLLETAAAVSRTLQAFSSFAVADQRLVSILRQSSILNQGLHVSQNDIQRRIKSLRSRNSGVENVSYGEPVPIDDGGIMEWCISRIEDWARQNGMEVFKEEEARIGRLTITLGGKVLVIDVDLTIQSASPNMEDQQRVSVSNVKTSHALPFGNSGNALAERSRSLDAYILRTWNDYFQEVQKNDDNSSMHAAYISRAIQSNLSYLMELDSLAFREGDQGIRWFNDTGLMNAVTDRISKTEVDALSSMTQSSAICLDIFLSRAHALGIPYLVSPSMSFLVYVSPLSYLSLLRASAKECSRSSAVPLDATDAFGKLDIPLATLREQLTQRHSRPPGTVIAALTLAPVLDGIPPDRRPEQRASFSRPHFRLPGTSGLDALDHFFLTALAEAPRRDVSSARDMWVLDFTDGGQSSGIVMTHSRMRDIKQVINPIGTSGGLGFGIQMQIPPLPGNWVGLLINPTLPPSVRYAANYRSPSGSHPSLRLRLTAPSEAGFLLQRVPVASLKEAYGVLEIVRDQCWINETLKTVQWTAEDMMPEEEDDRDDADSTGTAEEELEALLNGTSPPGRIPVNVFLPDQPPFSNNADAAEGLDMDVEPAVPGLSSVSMSIGGYTPPPCIALGFTACGVEADHGLRQVALVIRHDRTRKRGVRVDVNVSSLDGAGFGTSFGEQPSPRLVEGLEESSRRGAAFGTPGKLWSWLTSKET